MDKPDALQRWLAQMQDIEQQLNLLMADASLNGEIDEPLQIMQEKARHFLRIASENIEIMPEDSRLALSSVSFDLRPLINFLAIYCQALVEDVYGEVLPQHRQMIQSIEQSVNTIVGEIREFSDLE